jgi:hypothetical protein
VITFAVARSALYRMTWRELAAGLVGFAIGWFVAPPRGWWPW